MLSNIDQVNAIDQHCMDSNSDNAKQWIRVAEQTLDKNCCTNWTDLDQENPAAISTLIDLADFLKVNPTPNSNQVGIGNTTLNLGSIYSGK